MLVDRWKQLSENTFRAGYGCWDFAPALGSALYEGCFHGVIAALADNPPLGVELASGGGNVPRCSARSSAKSSALRT